MIAALVRKLTELGATAEMTALVVEVFLAHARLDSVDKKSARNRRYYEKHKRLKTPENALIQPPEKRLKTPEKRLTPTEPTRARVRARASESVIEENLFKKEESPKGDSIGQPRKIKTPDSAASVRAILSNALSSEMVDAVVAWRIKKRCPLTDLAAKGLVREFRATGRPDDAATMMVERGWQGFRAEWFENTGARPGPNGNYANTPRAKKEARYEEFRERMKRVEQQEIEEKYGFQTSDDQTHHAEGPDRNTIDLSASEFRRQDGGPSERS